MASLEAFADPQVEKSFQKQPTVFQGNRRLLGGKKNLKKTKRYYREVGLGFKAPAAALSGSYIDKKCPFTGNVSIRGRILRGLCVSSKMKRTIVVRKDYLHYVKKYNRYEKRHSNISVHCSPAFKVTDGDIVTIGECRPLSKTVRFNVIRIEKKKIEGNVKKQFVLF
eukprot:TRINITY_DN7131_c0_g2_i4.p1 TRINITY_DN7131_c0_g2~~TRINITY_DN7131_c0_g2_i4.p1  ORF type:complete len:174 (+),score=36.47 TRINITY_DN7131_c0_g2_i4:22-522(+)